MGTNPLTPELDLKPNNTSSSSRKIHTVNGGSYSAFLHSVNSTLHNTTTFIFFIFFFPNQANKILTLSLSLSLSLSRPKIPPMDATPQAVLAAAASFFVVTIIFAIIYTICKENNKNRSHHHRHNRNRSAVRNRDLSSITTGESATFDPSLSRISMDELLTATKNFAASGIIGDGSFGLVYKATLSNGVTVAVKKLSPDAFQGFREFRAEMDTLGQLRHPNIVKILGYCISGPDRVLIYEFIEKGSLDQWLHDTSLYSDNTSSFASTQQPFSWEMRIMVVRSAANGLAYLHGLDNPIIHRDIKASNVLLDTKFQAHIADFGLARRIEGSDHSHVSTQVAGTMGYMPPEYKEGFTAATTKADVYSFGVLMLEIATGKRPNLPVSDMGKSVGLVEWAIKLMEQNKVIHMVDPILSRDKLKEVEVVEFFRIACLCASKHSRDRPAMSEVVELLNGIST